MTIQHHGLSLTNKEISTAFSFLLLRNVAQLPTTLIGSRSSSFIERQPLGLQKRLLKLSELHLYTTILLLDVITTTSGKVCLGGRTKFLGFGGEESQQDKLPG